MPSLNAVLLMNSAAKLLDDGKKYLCSKTIKAGSACCILFIFLLTGCSLLTGEKGPFRNKSFDYQKAQNIPRIETTASDGKKISFSEDMPIPKNTVASGFKSTPTEIIPAPPSLIHLDEQSGLALSRKNKQEWILVAQPISLVWKKVEEFWQQKNIPLAVADVRSGIIETSWQKKNPFQAKLSVWARMMPAKKAMRAKFRLQIKSDVDGKTGILLSYLEVSELQYLQDKKRFTRIAEDDVLWQQLSEPDTVRGQAVQAISQLFITPKEVSFPQGEYLKPKRILLTQDGNHYPVLELEQEFAPAWANIGFALQKAHIQVDDLNRSLGIYYIRYEGEEKKSITTYELKVSRAEKDIHVTLQINDNLLASAEVSQEVLKKIYAILGK